MHRIFYQRTNNRQARAGTTNTPNEKESDLVNLKSLCLGGKRNITDAGLAHLVGLTNLTYLDLGKTQITDTVLVHLKDLTNLERLSLDETKVTDAGLAAIWQTLPNCYIKTW